jgi:hypothetical protein
MQQYQGIKARYPHALLLFRLGDFYELFYEDAIIAARELQITLTSRNREKGQPIPMCGVPYHAADGYIARLIRAGFKIAICDQMELPGPGKKIVRREVVRVITPGVFNVGGRFGWILTAPHGPGFLNGRFEYAVDVVPLFLVTQSNGTAYGFGVNPFALKWNFATHGSVVPYLDIGGGTLFTNIKTPPGTSHVNFTTSGALGAHFLRSKYNWSVEVRYMHISNAGISRPNPGINTIQVRLGFGMFTQPQ